MSTSQPAGAGPSGPLVFIVDDEELIGNVLTLSLAAHNYRTRLFHDPATALEEFRRSDLKPDILITDFNMPGMTGFELIRQCKAIESQLKTILCSGTVEPAYLKPLTPRPDAFISKPFSVATLIGTIKGLLPQQCLGQPSRDHTRPRAL